jgi:hypothetical protein
MERQYLECLQFDINVSSSVYAKYYFELRYLAEAHDLILPLKLLDKPRAVRLEVMGPPQPQGHGRRGPGGIGSSPCYAIMYSAYHALGILGMRGVWDGGMKIITWDYVFWFQYFIQKEKDLVRHKARLPSPVF